MASKPIARTPTDFLAMAELIANPKKVAEVKADIEASVKIAEDMQGQLDAAQETLNNAVLANKKLDERDKDLSVRESALAKKQAVLEQAQALYDAEVVKFAEQRQILADAQQVLDQEEDSLAARKNTMEDWEARLQKQQEELDNALKLATAEHDKWAEKSEKLKQAVN